MGLKLKPRSEEEIYKAHLEWGFPPKEIEQAISNGIFKNLDEILKENPENQKYLFVDTHEEDRLLRASLAFMGGLGGYNCIGLMNRDFEDNWEDTFPWYRFFKREDFIDYKIIMCSELLNNKKEVNITWEKGDTKRFVKWNRFKDTPCYHLFVDIPVEYEYHIALNVLNKVFGDYCESRLKTK